jgi:hypothetical protein
VGPSCSLFFRPRFGLTSGWARVASLPASPLARVAPSPSPPARPLRQVYLLCYPNKPNAWSADRPESVEIDGILATNWVTSWARADQPFHCSGYKSQGSAPSSHPTPHNITIVIGRKSKAPPTTLLAYTINRVAAGVVRGVHRCTPVVPWVGRGDWSLARRQLLVVPPRHRRILPFLWTCQYTSQSLVRPSSLSSPLSCHSPAFGRLGLGGACDTLARGSGDPSPCGHAPPVGQPMGRRRSGAVGRVIDGGD